MAIQGARAGGGGDDGIGETIADISGIATR
jgi:hypothetical protein